MNHIQFFREQVRLGQVELAKRAGCSQPTISGLERGSTPGVDLARRIAAALAEAGAVNAHGGSISLDDVFPPREEDASKKSAA